MAPIKKKSRGNGKGSKRVKQTRLKFKKRRNIKWQQVRSHKRRTGRSSNKQNDSAGSSNCVIGGFKHKRLLKGLKKVGSKSYMVSKTFNRVDILPQQQVSTNLGLFHNGSGATIGVPSVTDTDQMYLTLRADQVVQASMNNGSAGYANTFKFWCRKIKLKTEYRNATTAPIDIAIYDIVARRDQNGTTVSGAVPNQTYAPAVGSPTLLFATGINDEVVPGLGTSAVTSNMPGIKPFQSEKFCHFYKVRGVNHMTLGPGESHIHWVTIKPSTLFNRAYTTQLSCFGGLTYFQMPIVRGGVAHDINDKTLVGYSEGGLDVVTEYRTELMMFVKNTTQVTRYEQPMVTPLIWQQVNEDVAALEPVVD